MYIRSGLLTGFYFDRSVPRVHDRVRTEVLVVGGFQLQEHRFGCHVIGNHRWIASISDRKWFRYAFGPQDRKTGELECRCEAVWSP